MSNFTSKNNRSQRLQADETILLISQEAEGSIEQELTASQKYATTSSSSNRSALLLHLALNTLTSSKNNTYLNSSNSKTNTNPNLYILYSRGYTTNTKDRKDQGTSINNKNEDRD